MFRSMISILVKAVILALVIIWLTGCEPPPTVVVLPTPTPISTPTATPPPTREPTPEPTDTPTPLPPLTLPVLAGTPVPQSEVPISPDNAAEMVELALWGKGEAQEVAFSPDGKLLAVGTTAGIWLYDAPTLNHLRFIEANWVGSLAFSADSATLAARRGGNIVAWWDVTTGEQLGSLKVGERLGRIALSLDDAMLAAVAEDQQVGLWDLERRERLRTPGGHPQGVGELAFSPVPSSGGSVLLAAVLADDTIRLWDMGTGTLLHVLEGHDDAVSSLAFSPDGTLLASGGGDGTIRLWDVRTGTLLRTLAGHIPYCLSFSPDGKTLASGGGTVRLWDVEMGTLLHTLEGHPYDVLSLAFSPDGAMLVSAGRWDEAVRLWDPKTGTSLGVLRGYNSHVSGLAISPDSTVFVSHSFDNQIQVWDVRSGQMVRTLEGHTDGVTNLALSPDGKTLASTQRWDNSIWIWNVATGQRLRTVASHVGGLALSPDGRMLTSGYETYDVQTGEMRHDLRKGLIGERYGAVFSPDGTKLASAMKLSRMTGKTAVTLWEAETGELLLTLEAPAPLTIFGAIAFSSDGKMVAAGGSGARVWLWDVETGELLRTLEGYPAEMMSVAFSPDGALLAAGVRDRVTPSGTPEPTIRLWDVRTGRLLPALEGYTADIYYVSFSPDGTMLISGSSDGTVRLWGVPPAE